MKQEMSDREVGQEVLRRATLLQKKKKHRIRQAGIVSATAGLAALVVVITMLSPGETGTVENGGTLAAQGTAGALVLRNDIGGYILLGLLCCLVIGMLVLGIVRLRKRMQADNK